MKYKEQILSVLSDVCTAGIFGGVIVAVWNQTTLGIKIAATAAVAKILINLMRR